jgi:hypothetical protein
MNDQKYQMQVEYEKQEALNLTKIMSLEERLMEVKNENTIL